MSIRPRSKHLEALVAAALIAWTPTWSARAQDDEALIQEGVQLRREGRDAEALERFEAAIAIRSTPRGLGQAGLAAHAIGHWVEAERYLQSALEVASDPWIERNRATLQAMLAEAAARLGTLEVVGGVEGAAVTLDGRALGTLPLDPVRLVAGSFTLEVRAEGYYPISRIVVIPPQRLVRESLDMTAIPMETAPPPAISPPPLPETTESGPAPDDTALPFIGGEAPSAAPAAVAPGTPEALPTAPPRDGPEPYVGVFFVTGPTARTWLVGADLRVSVPLVDLGTEHLSLSLGFEIGALYGNQWTPGTARREGERPYWWPPLYELDLRAGLTPGVQARWGLLTFGARVGYEAWISQDGRIQAYFGVSHAFVMGLEVGVGVPLFTARVAFDLHVTGDGWVMPLLGVGICI